MSAVLSFITGVLALSAGALAQNASASASASSSSVPGLSQEQTNGKSLWGTLDREPLRHHMPHGGEGLPWGDRSCRNTNPTDPPETGRVVRYDWTLSREPLSPDGYRKNVLLVNGQFPGPLLEANWGDIIEVTVHNNITGPEEGTAMHFHGFTQLDTPWMDGVPSVSQCPVAPGQTFVYRFRATQYGSSWYHSHYSVQYPGGMHGPTVVHGPSSAPYDIDLGPVFVTEWYHKDYLDLALDVVSTNESRWRPFADNNMINGKMNYDCSLVTDGTPCTPNAGTAKFRFQQGKTHRLRLINGGAAAMQHFAIDGHNMTVIANDFVDVEPYQADVIHLAPGQRTDILVEGTGNIDGAYWMRSNVSDYCAFAYHPMATAGIYYDRADTNADPTTQPAPGSLRFPHCDNDPLEKSVPAYKIPAEREADITVEMEFDKITNSTGHRLWRVNQVAFHAHFNEPTLLLAKDGNTSYPSNPEWNVFNMGNHKTVRIVMYNNDDTATHPMHIHGHDAFVIAEGPGRWDGHTMVNMDNPQRRDTQMMKRMGHLVFQYEQDNPGVWAIHCHVAWHLSQGFYANLMERPDDIRNLQIPQEAYDTCKHWDDYSAHNVVDQLDSGV